MSDTSETSSCQSDGNSDTASLHTLNAAISTLSMLSTTFHLSEQSVSLHENITKMKDFISMLSSTSDESFEAEMSVHLMYKNSIRMLALLDCHHKLAGITRQKMETLLQEGSNDQATKLAQVRTGRRSLQRRTLILFGNYVRVWLREHSYVISTQYEHSPNGGINPILLSMNRPGEFLSALTTFQVSLNGYDQTLQTAE